MDTYCCTDFKFSSDSGQVEGYGARFNNVDQGQDRILPGAFAKTLEGRKSLPMLFSHDQAKPIGAWKALKEDGRGLYVLGAISDTTLGRDVRTLAKDGAVTGLSIGFFPKRAKYVDEVREIHEIELVEVSVVTFPMNELARVQSVKSAIGRGDEISRSDYELILRHAGISRRKSKRLLDHGYQGLSRQHQAVQALERLAATLTRKA